MEEVKYENPTVVSVLDKLRKQTHKPEFLIKSAGLT